MATSTRDHLEPRSVCMGRVQQQARSHGPSVASPTACWKSFDRVVSDHPARGSPRDPLPTR